jgi:serpin B
VTETSGIAAVAEGNNRYASDLYAQLDRDPANAGINIFFSPYSISSALAIVDEGARGTTAKEIQSVFSFPENITVQREGFAGIDAGLNAQDSRYSLSTANALWAEKTYPFLPAYTNTAECYYDANTTNLDFINQPEASRVTINTWVAKKTNDKIQDLLPQGSVTPNTRLVVTNAIYFKGTWVNAFDKNKTELADFSVTPTRTVQVPMMQRTDSRAVFPYAETDAAQVLEMPYAHGSGNEISMVIILPKGNNLTAAAELLNPEALAAVDNTSVSRQVKVYIPRFTLETEYDLTDTLADMGMPTAFTGNADFSGMDGSHDLSISDVVHKAYIDVNEEGTEAAAATGAMMSATAFMPEDQTPVFNADHPFIFLIEDTTTNTVLFTGRVTNPVAE